ncbi:MAG: MBL fold metallo-hydrolase [bacterium]
MRRDLEVRLVPVGPLEGNCYLVKCGEAGEGVVVDPGEEPERLAEEIEAMGLRPETILLTHGHVDHTNAAAALRERFGAKVACHPADCPMVEGAEGARSLFGFERRPCAVDRRVEEGDALTVGGKEFKVLHTPGHTGGSVCYLIGQVLFTGDTLFQGSIGRTDLPGGSDRDMARTLLGRIAKLDDALAVYPGHGPATTIADEKRLNPFLQAEW